MQTASCVIPELPLGHEQSSRAAEMHGLLSLTMASTRSATASPDRNAEPCVTVLLNFDIMYR